MEQLTFELAPAEPPSFANFVTGDNREVVARLRDLAAARDGAATTVVVWGAHGVGKTHLLRACVAACADAGSKAAYEERDAPRIDDATMLAAVDDVDRASSDAQARLFTLYNALAARGGRLVVAANVPPARMVVRDDLRTRLGHGLVYEVLPLSDLQKARAMMDLATRRGFALPPEVVEYLLAREGRDLRTLLAMVGSLDRYSLAQRRAVTVPLVRELLGRRPPA